MLDCYITFQSLTAAQQGLRAMQGAQLRVQLTRAPKAIAEQGCAYALLLARFQLSAAQEALRSRGLAYRRAFCVAGSGELQEVRL